MNRTLLPWFMHHAVNTSVMSIFDKFKLTVICTSLAFFALWLLLKIVTTHGICGWYRIQGWGTKKMYSNKKAISVVCTEYMLLKSNNCNFFFWNNVWNKLEWVLTRNFATEYMKIWTVNGCTYFWIFWTLRCELFEWIFTISKSLQTHHICSCLAIYLNLVKKLCWTCWIVTLMHTRMRVAEMPWRPGLLTKFQAPLQVSFLLTGRSSWQKKAEEPSCGHHDSCSTPWWEYFALLLPQFCFSHSMSIVDKLRFVL
jgi:hypothetical protein